MHLCKWRRAIESLCVCNCWMVMVLFLLICAHGMCSRLLASIYAESRQKLAINVFHGGLAKHRRMTTSSSARHYDRVQHDTHNVFLRASVIIGSAASK